MAGGVLSFIAGRRDKRLRDLVAGAVTLAELALFLPCRGLMGAVLSLAGLCGPGLSLTLDGFRLIYGVIIAFMWAATTLFSPEYLEHHRNRNRYYLFVLMTEGAIMGVFLSADLFTTFVFFEMMSLFSYIMVVQDETPAALRAAQTYLAIAIIGGLATLTGLLLLRHQLGTLVIADLPRAAGAVKNRAALYLSGGLVFAGFAAKAAIFPAHVWLPTAHTAAPAPSSALLSGLLTKSGLFGVLALSAGPFLHDARWGLMLLALALVTMVLGAVLAVFSVNLKRTLACSSMSQLGFILTGIAMQNLMGKGNDLAVRGTILYMVGHSLIKLVLFLSAGVVHMNTHRLDLNDIRGFGRGRPLFLFAFLMGGLGLMGMPLWNGYPGKTLIHEAIVEHIHHIGHAGTGALLFRAAEWTFLLSGALTTAYVLKLFFVLFVSEPATRMEALVSRAAQDAPACERPPELHEKEPYITPLSAAVLAVSAAALPLLGALPHVLADPIAFLGSPFMHGPAGHHAVSYFSLASLEGAGISLSIGLLIFLFIVRPFLMFVPRWPGWLDLEERLFRPFLAGALPGAGAFFAGGVDRAADAAVRALPFLGALGGRVMDRVCSWPVDAALFHATRVRFIQPPEDALFGIYPEEDRAAYRLPSTLAWALAAFSAGLLFVMAWLL